MQLTGLAVIRFFAAVIQLTRLNQISRFRQSVSNLAVHFTCLHFIILGGKFFRQFHACLIAPFHVFTVVIGATAIGQARASSSCDIMDVFADNLMYLSI
jgi:hypothetical protein